MSLRGRFSGATDPSGFTCPHYSPPPGSKRCRHFLSNGACDRPDELMCTEWLKANSEPLPSLPSSGRGNTDPKAAVRRDPGVRVDRDLFGNPLPPRPEVKPTSASEPRQELSQSVEPAPSEPGVSAESLLTRNLSDEEIASFKSLGAEVCVNSPDIGEIWLVPEYTGEDRNEISIEHAATLSVLCAVFPEARIKEYKKESNKIK